MTPALFLDWQLSRLGRSGTVALAGAAVLACAVAWTLNTNRERLRALEQAESRVTESAGTRDAAAPDVDGWRQSLATGEARLPDRGQVTVLIRAALASIEASGVSVDALAISSSKVPDLPYEVITLDARLSGQASRAARALSQILTGSPGWAIESLVLERRAAGQVAAEATLSLLVRDEK